MFMLLNYQMIHLNYQQEKIMLYWELELHLLHMVVVTHINLKWIKNLKSQLITIDNVVQYPLTIYSNIIYFIWKWWTNK
jgi:hypothetical protein